MSFCFLVIINSTYLIMSWLVGLINLKFGIRLLMKPIDNELDDFIDFESKFLRCFLVPMLRLFKLTDLLFYNTRIYTLLYVILFIFNSISFVTSSYFTQFSITSCLTLFLVLQSTILFVCLSFEISLIDFILLHDVKFINFDYWFGNFKY